MKTLAVSLAVVFLCIVENGVFSKGILKSTSKGDKFPEVYMNARQIVEYNGYPAEEHWVTTEDGYILYLLRIPHGRDGSKKQSKKKERPVVLLQHGLLTSCDIYLLDVREGNLPFVLADLGVDVWLGNNRGSRYSINHTTLNPDQLEFWDFSWDQMAEVDLPATIYYVMNQTNSEQIYYAAVSQGTAIGFAQFSQDQVLASRIKHFLAFSPIGRVGHSTSALRDLLPFAHEIEYFCNIFGHGKFDIPRPILRLIAEDVCKRWGTPLCENELFLLLGSDGKELNTTRLPVYMAHNPDSASVKTLLQWAQGVRDNLFQKYDFGSPSENLKHYGQTTPPLYDPRKIRVPVAIFRGGKDALADPTDVAWLLPQLNVTHDISVPYYNHMDPIASLNARNVTFPTVIKIILGN